MNNDFDWKDIKYLTHMLTLEEQWALSDEKALKNLITEISKYDVFDFITRISSLNLLLENQNKSILLDAIISGLLAQDRLTYTGKTKMSGGKFKKIITQVEDFKLRRMIDPSENTFIERVRYYGNYWIFPGINYSPSYCLQGFLDVLCLRDIKWNNEFSRKANLLIQFILQISDDIVHKLGYGTESIIHKEVSNIVVPNANLMEKLKNCVLVNYSLISEMISDESVVQCLFSDFENNEISQAINSDYQSFFSHPFLKINNEVVIILNPSILVSFVIHQIVLFADEYGEKERLINSYNTEIWKKCKRDFYNLGHKRIKEELYNITLINNQCHKEEILSAGSSGLLFIQFICDDGIDYRSSSMFDERKIDNYETVTRNRAEFFAKQLPSSNWDKIYQVIILNSFGRRISTVLTSDEISYTIRLSPFELHCISVNEKEHEFFLPKYINAKKQLKIPFSNVNELNIIELYTSANYSFYFSDDFDPKTTHVYFGTGDSLEYIIRAMKKEDRHLIESYDGVHLAEVFLDDPIRKIYFTVSHYTDIECIVKFEKINIWIVAYSINSIDEGKIYTMLIDTISYWLSELESEINEMNFAVNTICLHITLLSPIDQYFIKPNESVVFEDNIHYDKQFNVIQMAWGSKAYCLLGNMESNNEKKMMKSILQQVEKLSSKPFNRVTFDKVFSNPYKKKIYEINRNNDPYLLPTSGKMRTISVEDENILLNEIGEYFLSSSEYSYGKVPDTNRIDLSNKVVSYLYNLLQVEIANISQDYLYELVYLDLETVIHNEILLHRRYIYDVSCYPENAEKMIEKFKNANHVSIALKFLAEYIAAIHPRGQKPVDTFQYERILAICSLLIDWAYKNDLYKFHIIDSPITILKSGRIGMSHNEEITLNNINISTNIRRLEVMSDPNAQRYSPFSITGDLQNEIDNAFIDEYGFTFSDFSNCIYSIIDYGDNFIQGDVKRTNRDNISEFICEKTSLTSSIIKKIIDQISLQERDDFLIPPEPYEQKDVYPWRLNRELSFTRRPIIQFENDLIWGTRQLSNMVHYTIELLLEGKYFARSSKLRQLMGRINSRRGNDFNEEVYRKLTSFRGLIVCEKLKKINGKRIIDDDGNELGDIDILYLVVESKEIIVAEVKEFSFAKNPYEMYQEYTKIFVDGKKPCCLTKHKRRVDWVKKHKGDVLTHCKINSGGWIVKSVMFVSEPIISNLYYHRHENIIVYSDICEANVKNIA